MDYRAQQTKSNRPVIIGSLLGAAVLFLVWNTWSSSSTPPFSVTKAVAVLSGDSSVKGTVTFTQASPTSPVAVSGKLTGLDKNAKRGFHIHTLGDTSGGCVSAGSHFNPLGATHGAPSDGKTTRHAGDLGNIQSDADGVVQVDFEDSFISLSGPFSILGRTVMVHAGTDDLGRGGDDESLKTGNAGGRAACGVIGIAELA